MAGAAAGFLITKKFVNENSYIPSVFIAGDVLNVTEIDSRDSIQDWETIYYDDRKLQASRLEKLLALAEPAGNEYSVYLIADDGRAAKLPGLQIGESYIAYEDENGWEAINFNHPVSTNIKQIREVIVVLEAEEPEYGLKIIDMEKNIATITPGQVNLAASRFMEYAGTSFKAVEGKRYKADNFKLKHIFMLENFLESESYEKMILMGSRGEYRFVDNTGYFELDGNVFNYVDSPQNENISDLKGVVINPVSASIMDVYYDATGFIDSGKNVLLIIADGFGYHQYEYAFSNGHVPYLASLKKADKALSVYKPVSNPGLAAMFTGRPPEENGVYSRKQREPSIPTIFGELSVKGKKSVFIEGDIQILKLEIESVLNTDRNSSGTIDDEIFNAAMESLASDAAFIAVHFHSIDDAGHGYGIFSDDAMERVRVIDSYIEQLASKWDGKLIITADHGMHDTEEGGNHGEFRFEDMVVPYILTDGGL